MTEPCDPGCTANVHGTASAFRHGCRSEAAFAAQRRYAKARRTGRHQYRWVDNTGVCRRLQALAAMGWSSRELGARLGVGAAAVNQLRSGRHRANLTNVAKVTALYDELGMIPGGDERTARESAAKGWHGPLAWDEHTIDDPEAKPDLGGVDRQPDENVIEAILAGRVTWADLSTPDREHLVGTLFRRGWPTAEIAERARGDVDDVRRAHERVQARRKREAAA